MKTLKNATSYPKMGTLTKMVRNLIYITYFTLVFTSIIILFVNLPPIFETQNSDLQDTEGLPKYAKSSRERLRKNYRGDQLAENIPENEKPFRWMETRENFANAETKQRTSQFRNLTNLLQHKLFLSNLAQIYSNLTSPKKLPFMSHSSVNPVVENFYREIASDSLYPVNSPWIDWIKTLLKSNKITYAENKAGGSQLKLSVKYEANLLGLLKPMRLTRDQQTFPDHFYFVDLERHNAEIASFHLDQILDFRRAPPVVGRWINLTDLWRLSDHRLTRTFFKSPADNTCFHGTCDYYCRTETPVCGHPHSVEASVALYLPDSKYFPRSMTVHPYRR